jgi:diguanylate cyclase (GGDEF)-like protein
LSPRPEDTHKLKELLELPPTTESRPLTVERPVQEACLVHIHPPGPALGSRWPVKAAPLTIGRASACDVTDPDSTVSRTHARVERGADGEFRVIDLGSANGTYVNHARVAVGVLRDGDYLRVGGSLYRFLAAGNLEAAYHEEIHRLVVTDPLTGLPNRRALGEFLEREADRARRRAHPLSVLLLDIDHFKAVNDRLGHLAGDDALRTLAAVVGPLVRRDELLARYGGEEFAVVLPGTGGEDARRCGERLRQAVEGRQFEFAGRSYPVTVSVGVGAAAAGEKADPVGLLGRADLNLYEAKRAGRNRVVG